MKPGELIRLRVAFGALGAVPVFLAGWLGWLQVAQAGQIERGDGAPLPLVAGTADRQGWRRENVPAPRGTIVDRNGHTLAADCPTYDVRARVVVPRASVRDVTKLGVWLRRLVDDVAVALVADYDGDDRGERREAQRARLLKLIEHDLRVNELPASGAWPKDHPGVADVLIAGGVDHLAVIEALRKLTRRKEYGSVTFDFLHSYRRSYPDRDLTYGLVGHCDSEWVTEEDGSRSVRVAGKCGLETFAALDPDDPGFRRYLRDGKGRRYFVAPVEGAPASTVLHTTLDLELQRAASCELEAACEAGSREDPTARPKWGALVLVEIETGDLLAAASWHRDAKHPKEATFAPYQNLFEPGSIVKPLVLAYALEVGALDWDHVYDCNPRHEDYRSTIAGLGRRKAVVDDHDCGELTPHGIIVNSSNIGAALIGLQLEREQWSDYMRGFGFGATLGLRLPFEMRGGPNPRSFAADVPLRSFRANSAISFSFGYELNTTTMQIARAYLRMFRGLGAELRLCRGLEIEGEYQSVPPQRDTGPKFRPVVVDAVRRAMVDVVSDDPHATGHKLRDETLRETGIELHGLLGGKTGTAASMVGLKGGGSMSMRNASFVGFLPAEQPRWLAVCVLQKDSSARFYGGSYAAPPAARLLLRCQSLAERGRLRQESLGVPQAGGQTRLGVATPGDSGWSPAAGAAAVRDTR